MQYIPVVLYFYQSFPLIKVQLNLTKLSIMSCKTLRWNEVVKAEKERLHFFIHLARKESMVYQQMHPINQTNLNIHVLCK